MILHLAPNDQQRPTYQPMSGSYVSNGVPAVPVPVPKESSDMVTFHSNQRLTQSTPGSPQDHGRPTSFEVVGSAESLVGRVRNYIHSYYYI